jgi:Flp pilus assembly protein TadD
VLLRADALHPEDALTHNALGTLNADRKKYAAAEKEYRQALIDDPSSRSARYNLAMGNFTAGPVLAASDSLQPKLRIVS